jgi:hypothetical protein
MRINEPEKPHGWRDVIASVVAAGLGVQSEKNRQRDFAHGSPKQFLIVAIGATLLFVVGVYVVVRLIVTMTGV